MSAEPLRVRATVGAPGEVLCAPGATCPRCARGEGCGQAAWFSRRQPCRLTVLTGAAQPGQEVMLELPARRLLQAAALVYGLPLAGLLGGAVAGQGAGEAGAALAGVVGLLAGVIAARRLARRFARRLSPTVIGPAAAAAAEQARRT